MESAAVAPGGSGVSPGETRGVAVDPNIGVGVVPGSGVGVRLPVGTGVEPEGRGEAPGVFVEFVFPPPEGVSLKIFTAKFTIAYAMNIRISPSMIYPIVFCAFFTAASLPIDRMIKTPWYTMISTQTSPKKLKK